MSNDSFDWGSDEQSDPLSEVQETKLPDDNAFVEDAAEEAVGFPEATQQASASDWQDDVAEQPEEAPEPVATTVEETSDWDAPAEEEQEAATQSQQAFQPSRESTSMDTLRTNTVSGQLTEKDREFILSSIEDIKHRLSFAAELSGERSLCRLTASSRQFVSKAMKLATSNPDFLPRSFDVEEFERDVQLLEALEPIKKELAELSQLVDQLIDAAGSDAFTSALEVYQDAKMSRKGEELDAFVTAANRQFT